MVTIKTSSGRHIMGYGEILKTTKTQIQVKIISGDCIPVGTICKYNRLTGRALRGSRGAIIF